jgi:hypothetical protein
MRQSQIREINQLNEKFHYIYTVSPIWLHTRSTAIGTLTLQPRKANEEVSAPMRIRGCHVKTAPVGLTNTLRPYVIEGIDIVRQFLGLDQSDQPADKIIGGNCLINYGCFTTDQPFEQLPPGEREEIRAKAVALHDIMVADTLARADAMFDSGDGKFVAHSKIFHACTRYMGDQKNHRWSRAPREVAEEKKALKECKSCAEEVAFKAKICRFCGRNPDVEPTFAEDVPSKKTSIKA